MKIHSLAIGAVLLGALTTISVSQTKRAASIPHLQPVGEADTNSLTHFNVYLPLTNRSALEQLLRDQTDSTSPKYHKWLKLVEGWLN